MIPDAVIPSANESTTVEIEDESKTIESEDEIKQELSLEISEDNILELNVSAQEMGDTVVELEPEEDELFLEEIHDTTEEVIEDQKGEAEDEEIGKFQKCANELNLIKTTFRRRCGRRRI